MAGKINVKIGSPTAESTTFKMITADLSTLITGGTGITVDSYTLQPPDASITDVTAYRIECDTTAQLGTVFADVDAVSEKTQQPCHFNAATYWECFEYRAITAEPPDFRDSENWKYYIDNGGNKNRMSQAQYNGFTVRSYYVNDTLQAPIYTENDGFIGAAVQFFRDPYNPICRPFFSIACKWTYEYWQTNYNPLQNAYYRPQMPSYPSTAVWNIPNNAIYKYWALGTNEPNADANPTCPDVFTAFVNGVYNSVKYIGIMAYFKNASGFITKCCMYLLPQWFWGSVTPTPSQGYWGPSSTFAGGTGTYTDTNDTPSLPSSPPNFYSAIASGNYGLHVYRVQNMASWDAFQSLLWGVASSSGSDLWARWQNYKFNPIAGVIGAHFLPSQLLPTSSSSVSIRLAGVVLPLATAYDLSAKQFSDFDCGTLQIPEYFGTAMDYSPYTKMRLYLPFCGVLDVDADRCMGGEINIKYRCDVITGNVCAYVFLTDRTGSCTAMLHATGNCAVSIPITGNDNGTGQILGALGSVVMGAATGNTLGVLGGVSSALTAQHHMQQTGSVSGSVAAITPLDVRLEIVRPCVSTPENGTDLRGRPADISVTISDLVGTGYAQFEDVHPDIVGATDAECAEIEKLLLGGVIL